MPAEGERLLWRIGRRDRLFLAVVAVALVGGVTAALLVGPGSGPGAGCVSYSHPGPTGGATYTFCGRRAARFCRSAARDHGAAVVAACERLGLRVGPGRAAGHGG